MPKPWRIQVPSVQRLKHLRSLRERLTLLEESSVSPDSYSYERLLQTCACLSALAEGRRIHAHLVRTGFGEDRLFLENHLLNMYAKCGSVDDTRKLVASMQELNVVSWNTIIGGHAQNGQCMEALAMYQRMQLEGAKPSRITFTNVLAACTRPELISHGQVVHASVLETEPGSVILQNSLISMYGKCLDLAAARAVFDGMTERTAVSWNTLIAAYVQSEQPRFTLGLFRAMQLDGVKPSSITFLALLNACSGPSARQTVKFLHRLITESGLESDNLLCTCLMTIYGKCGCLEETERVFRTADRANVVTWNAFFSAYSQEASLHGAERVVNHLRQMLAHGLKPVRITFLAVLGAFPTSKNAKLVQELAAESGFHTDPEVTVALSTMYTRAGDVTGARRAFHHQRNSQLDVVSWTTMMTTCSQNGLDREALYFFREMQLQGTRPTDFTIAVALEACANLVDAEQGRRLHLLALDNGFQLDEFIATGLVNLYGKSGKLRDAQAVFDEFGQSNLVLTTALIASYSQHGYGSQALQLYNLMQLEGEQPNDVTFVTILSACSHAGLLDEGTSYFKSMTSDHSIPASRQHYCCMVDLFGRLGHLDDAKEIINRMPYKPSEVAWLTLLGASTNQGDAEQGEQAIEQAGHLTPPNRNRRVTFLQPACSVEF